MPDHLENELRRLTPLPPSMRMETRIASALAYRASGPTSPLGETLLRSLLSLGAAAAVVIITLFASDWTTSTPTAPVESAATTGTESLLTVADSPRLLARLSDATTIDSPTLPQN